MCSCDERPRCQMYGGNCGNAADGSLIILASWFYPMRETAKFSCVSCYEFWDAAWRKPIKGWDRPADAPDDWRPSIMEVLRWGLIAEADRLRRENPPPLSAPIAGAYTPAQLQQLAVYRRALRNLREGRHG